MPIPLGILAASRATAPAAAGSFDLLETQVLGSTTASVTFSNLNAYASTYQHLQIRIMARSTRAAADSNLSLRFNGDSTSNYRTHSLTTYPGYFGSSGTSTSTSILCGAETGSTSTADAFAATVIDILDPFESTKNKTIRALSGYALSNYLLTLNSGLWMNTASVTSITIGNWDGASHAQYSRFSLYGWKAA